MPDQFEAQPKTYFDNELALVVGKILYFEWDPIGIKKYSGIFDTRDEYRSYTPGLIHRLITNDSSINLHMHLLELEEMLVGKEDTNPWRCLITLALIYHHIHPSSLFEKIGQIDSDLLKPDCYKHHLIIANIHRYTHDFSKAAESYSLADQILSETLSPDIDQIIWVRNNAAIMHQFSNAIECAAFLFRSSHHLSHRKLESIQSFDECSKVAQRCQFLFFKTGMNLYLNLRSAKNNLDANSLKSKLLRLNHQFNSFYSGQAQYLRKWFITMHCTTGWSEIKNFGPFTDLGKLNDSHPKIVEIM